MQDKNSHSAATRLRPNSPNTEKSIRSSNFVQQITIFQPPVPCSLHCYDTLNYICIDCQFKCLCGTCLQEGHHKNHHVKSIQKGSKIVQRSLNEALIRLRSKSDLLSNLKEYMKIRKSQIFHQYSEYQKMFSSYFLNIASVLEEKRRSIVEIIQNYHNSLANKLDQLLKQANNESNQAVELISVIQDQVERFKMYPTSLCLFYQSKNSDIDHMVNEVTHKFEMYKSEAPECNWMIDAQIFEVIKDKIRNIDIIANENEISLFSKRGTSENKKKPVKKGQGNKLEKVNSQCQLGIGCATPKNIQSYRDIYASFKSPPIPTRKKITQAGKLNSMPVSPSKEKTPKKRSPNRTKLDEMGKKFKKAKK